MQRGFLLPASHSSSEYGISLSYLFLTVAPFTELLDAVGIDTVAYPNDHQLILLRFRGLRCLFPSAQTLQRIQLEALSQDARAWNLRHAIFCLPLNQPFL